MAWRVKACAAHVLSCHTTRCMLLWRLVSNEKQICWKWNNYTSILTLLLLAFTLHSCASVAESKEYPAYKWEETGHKKCWHLMSWNENEDSASFSGSHDIWGMLNKCVLPLFLFLCCFLSEILDCIVVIGCWRHLWQVINICNLTMGHKWTAFLQRVTIHGRKIT